MSIMDTKPLMSCSQQSGIVSLLIGSGRQEAESWLQALPSIEYLDILRNILYCLPPGPVPAMIGQFLLECSPETFHRRIVVAITFPAHRCYEAMPFQNIPEIMGAVLTATVGVVQKPLSLPLKLSA